MQKVLLDTDIGGDIDDAICLAYLLKEPRCQLLGITTVCGQSEKRAAVADALCRCAGEDIPIVAGLSTPLSPVPVYPTPDGAAALPRWTHRDYEKGDAPAFLYQQIREHPHQVVLLGIGNMTNIASLFQAHPDAPGLLQGLWVMNGYFGREPLPDPTYNWNAWADPLASRIVFGARVGTHRAIPLEVTDILTLPAGRAKALLPRSSPLMEAVLDFGGPWLSSAGKLTLHDPLVAVSLFHPDLCTFQRGVVQVETVEESRMGATSFRPAPEGPVEIARTVDRERFYQILSSTLAAGSSRLSKATPGREVPPLVRRRAETTGPAGEAWLGGLDSCIDRLQTQWNIEVGAPLAGGTHAYVAPAQGRGDGRPYVLKIESPETEMHGDFAYGLAVLKLADGQGYPRLYAWDEPGRACLLERLGRPLSDLGLQVDRQIEIVCKALTASWEIPIGEASLPPREGSVSWFRSFMEGTWQALGRPCSERVLRKATAFLHCREAQQNPAAYVLVHGDPHSRNTLQVPGAPDCFKLIDPDGLFYEKAYDLGVLMREWPEAYRGDPVGAGRRRCALLHDLTGVDRQAIWQWGYLQTLSTGFVLLRTGQADAGRDMLGVAEAWWGENLPDE